MNRRCDQCGNAYETASKRSAARTAHEELQAAEQQVVTARDAYEEKAQEASDLSAQDVQEQDS